MSAELRTDLTETEAANEWFYFMEDAAFSGAIFFFSVSHFVFSDASSVDIYLQGVYINCHE